MITENIGLISTFLILINLIISYKGFTNFTFFQAYLFEVDPILINRDYKRLVTAGFLHVSWPHLILNMLSLWCFGEVLENGLGEINFLLLYFASLIGGNLLALYIHRHHGNYSAVGASGAICGIVFASIAVFPGLEIGFFGLPYYMPAWIYGLLYVLYTIYGIKSQTDAIGHEAHLGGGLVGLLIAIAIQPECLNTNSLPIVLILVPALIFIFIIIYKPNWMLVDNPFKTNKQAYTIEDKYNAKKRENEWEVDKLLDKINKKGIESLTAKEKETLHSFSNKK
ncbi:MAG: rhomboid family intramembrane serine protease [bacterium]|nr:rhomboid family intramembrane serine protease [bacterium]